MNPAPFYVNWSILYCWYDILNGDYKGSLFIFKTQIWQALKQSVWLANLQNSTKNVIFDLHAFDLHAFGFLPISTSTTSRIDERFTRLCLPNKCPHSQIASTISKLIRGLIAGKWTSSSTSTSYDVIADWPSKPVNIVHSGIERKSSNLLAYSAARPKSKPLSPCPNKPQNDVLTMLIQTLEFLDGCI